MAADSKGNIDLGGDVPEASVICVKCNDELSISLTLSAGRCGRVCKLCYNAQRSLVDYYKRRGKKDEWDRMPMERKKKLIVDNKLLGGTKGQQRNIKIEEKEWPRGVWAWWCLSVNFNV